MMEVNGLKAQVNTPEALKGDSLHALPPHCVVPACVVDEYPACPENWMHGSSKASSYFIPVQTGRGLWFDFTMNVGHTHDIAIVVSVQGVNPITGKKVTELNLEQYREKCPVHNTTFRQDRFCEECGYKWPAQNYIATTTNQLLWIDGFRNENGEVRQYIITEDITRGIAAQVIGNDRVWAIGFAFYLSKEPRHREASSLLLCPKTNYFQQSSPSIYGVDQQLSPNMYGVSNDAGDMCDCASDTSKGMTNISLNCCNASPTASTKGLYKSRLIRSCSVTPPITPQKTLEIGAGARINQEIGIDPNAIDFWQTEPAGLIYANYCSKETFAEIVAAGRRQDKKDGALNTLKVGNV
jgi:hypothetical protein